MKVLIVEDVPDILDVARMVLENAGHTVCVAETASAAKERLRERLHDVVILDYCVPNFDAPQFAKLAKERNPEIKIFLTTGLDDQKSLKQIKYDKLFIKPYDAYAVLQELNALNRP